MEETNKETIIKYSSYTQAQKRATQKYRENNKDKVNEQRKKYYQNRKDRDPEFLEYKRLKAKEYYQVKKHAKENKKLDEVRPEPVIVEPIIEPIIEPEPVIVEPIIEPPVTEPKIKKIRKSIKK